MWTQTADVTSKNERDTVKTALQPGPTEGGMYGVSLNSDICNEVSLAPKEFGHDLLCKAFRI